MIRTTKRVMTILLTLCLVATWLPTAALASGSVSIEANYSSGSLQAGQEANGSITVTATSGTFSNTDLSSLITTDGSDFGLTIGTPTYSADTTVTMTVSGTPTKGGTLTITAQTGAFASGDPSAELTATLDVSWASAPSVTVSGSLTAGTEGGSITLTTDGNSFADSLETSWFTLGGSNSGLSVTNAASSGTTATLTISGTPTASGSVTVESINKEAFKYQPQDNLSSSNISGNATISAPTVTGTVSGGPLTVGKEGTFTVTATGSDFASTNPDASLFTLSGGGVTQPTSVTATGSTATLTVTPTTATPITVTSISQDAFQYKPDAEVSDGSITGSVTVYAAVPTVTASGTLNAGSSGTITLTINGDNTFASSVEKSYFTLTGGVNGNPSNIGAGGNNTITLDVTPTSAETISISIDPQAFTSQPQSNASCTISVSPAATPSVTAEGTLTAGVAGTITLTIDGGSSNTFASSLQAGWFTLIANNGDNLTVTEAPSGGSDSITLNVSEATKAGQVTGITIDKQAFTYQPTDNVSVSCNLTINAATVAMTDPAAIIEGKDTTIALSLTAGTFAQPLTTDNFTVSGCGVSLKEVNRSNDTNATLTLTAAPTEIGPINVTAKQDAFKYQPAADVVKTVTVNAPSGTLSAELEGDALYAGTETSGQTIKLTAGGDLTFKSSLSTANTGYFTLSGDGSASLSVTNVTYTSSTEVSLTLSGTPKNSGAIEVEVDKDAFTYAPTDGQKATGSISVKEAPAVTLSGNEITAGNTNEITIQITDPDEAKFISGVAANKFTISGNGYTSLTVSEAAITDSGTNKNVKLTLSDTPTTNGTMTVTVAKDAFTPVASANTTASITVSQPDGTVTGTLAGGTATLTAGTAVTDTSISLTAGNTLNFKAQAQLSAENFTLSGDTGLTISGVTRSDSKNVSLSLTGTPKAGGTFTVTAQTSAFVAAPAAAKTTGSLTIGYPDVSVSPDPNHIAEEDDSVHSIKLTATNGVFNAVSGTSENFSFSSNITGITLSGVTATDGSNEATLAFTGTPESTGDLTITVQPGAFKYQPRAAVTAIVKIGKPEGTLSATLNGALYKGTPVSNQTIAVSITTSHGLHFKDSGLAATDFALINTDPGGLTITPAYVDPTHVTLTLSGTPSNSGTFQVQAKTTAFKLAPEGDITASDSITVNAAPTGSVSASLSGQLTAGMPVGSSTSITLTPTTLSFAAGLDTGKFTLNNADGLSISRVGSSGGNVVLALSGTPNAHTDNFTITVDRTAFTYYPDSNVTTSAVTINYPTIELDATPKHIAEGDETATSITLTATGSVFNTTEATDYFSVSGDTGVTLSAVKVETEGDTAVLTITPPTTEGALTITVQPDAFKYKPENAATATVSVGPPMGTLTGTLSGSLYAGTPVSGQTITVTISNSHGLHFKDSGLTAEDFALGGAGAAGLTIASVSGSGEAVTLTLSGTPTKAGAVTVTAKTTAFKLATDEDQTVTGSITVNAAPTVTVTTDSKLTVGAKADDITLTASGSSFKSDIAKNVTLSGDAAQGLTVSAVTVSGATATLTLSGTPTTAGELTVTISKDAFQPQAAADVTVTVTVNPKGTIEVESEGGGATLAMSSAELADAVLSEAERQMLANGASIEITLTEENVGSTVTATQRSTVQAAARGYTVGAYLNVELVKSINGGAGTLVTETNKPIKVTFKIPADLIKEGRKFGVVRLHDGTASLLDTVSSTSDTITVESKLFSLYAIVYQDGTPTASPSASPSASQQPVAPNTGDSAPLGLYTALLALCLTGLAVTLIRRKKNVR